MQEKGEEEKQDSPRTIDFCCRFAKELILQGQFWQHGQDDVSALRLIVIIMLLRRAIRGHPARRNVEEQELPNAPEVNPQGKVIIMLLRRAIRGHPARRNVEEQDLPNAPEVNPQGKVTNAEFREAIRMLSQVVTNQVGQQRGARQEEDDTSRIQSS
uniref:Gag-pol polyprotein n=1 Tax=Solanum tuberosum TaxID=4113 RepID=M1DZ22_SOLTU